MREDAAAEARSLCREAGRQLVGRSARLSLRSLAGQERAGWPLMEIVVATGNVFVWRLSCRHDYRASPVASSSALGCGRCSAAVMNRIDRCSSVRAERWDLPPHTRGAVLCQTSSLPTDLRRQGDLGDQPLLPSRVRGLAGWVRPAPHESSGRSARKYIVVALRPRRSSPHRAPPEPRTSAFARIFASRVGSQSDRREELVAQGPPRLARRTGTPHIPPPGIDFKSRCATTRRSEPQVTRCTYDPQ